MCDDDPCCGNGYMYCLAGDEDEDEDSEDDDGDLLQMTWGDDVMKDGVACGCLGDTDDEQVFAEAITEVTDELGSVPVVGVGVV